MKDFSCGLCNQPLWCGGQIQQRRAEGSGFESYQMHIFFFFPVFVLLFSINIQLNNCLTNRFHVAVRLFSNRSQMTSKCRKNKEVAHEPQASVSLLFLPHFFFDNCCEDFLQFRHCQVVNSFFGLRFSIFPLCKQLLLNFFRSFHLPQSEIISQTFSKPRAMLNKTK